MPRPSRLTAYSAQNAPTVTRALPRERVRSSAHPRRWPTRRRRSLHRTDNGRSDLGAGTGLHAPMRLLVGERGIVRQQYERRVFRDPRGPIAKSIRSAAGEQTISCTFAEPWGSPPGATGSNPIVNFRRIDRAGVDVRAEVSAAWVRCKLSIDIAACATCGQQQRQTQSRHR